ncbi:hypothetical protein [Photobacterium jeanii]|nr:hypothetical protein [Photobacterium jeanii]
MPFCFPAFIGCAYVAEPALAEYIGSAILLCLFQALADGLEA